MGRYRRAIEAYRQSSALLFRRAWSDLELPVNSLPNAAQALVHHVFGGNREYLRGRSLPECAGKPDPIPLLHQFYETDLTGLGVDQRQMFFEGHCLRDLSLGPDLLYLAVPESMQDHLVALLNALHPWTPRWDAYPAHRIFRPADVAADLAGRASDVFRAFIDGPRVPV